MIKVVRWSISIAGCLGVCLCTEVTANPFSVIATFRENMKTVKSLSAVVDRVQHFRHARRVSSGTLLFDMHYGSVYTWKTPGNYRFYRSVFGACGIDLTKQTGWKTNVGSPDPAVAEAIDPLYRFLRIASIEKEKIIYRGNKGNTLIFSTPVKSGMQFCMSFNAETSRCSVTELLDVEGNVAEKTKFLYTEGNNSSVIPSAMVITRVVGDQIAVDSLKFKKQVYNRKAAKEYFSIPKNIEWNDKVMLSSHY